MTHKSIHFSVVVPPKIEDPDTSTIIFESPDFSSIIKEQNDDSVITTLWYLNAKIGSKCASDKKISY